MIVSPADENHGLPNGGCQLSYAAGSTSLDPWGFRVIGNGDHQRIADLVREYPVLSEYLHANSLIISAYPAALGIEASVPFIDTYLHAPTFVRAMRLASQTRCTVVFAAQPLAGADLLFKLLETNIEIPTRVLWAAGGYYFPESLERVVKQRLALQGCELELLHCYGVAEVGHTCFAAMQRDAAGVPIYRLVASGIEARIDQLNDELVLANANRTIRTGDRAECVGASWRMQVSPERLCAEVHRELERWSNEEWENLTGYLEFRNRSFIFQRREHSRQRLGLSSLSFHQFWEQCGGSLQSKPVWRRLGLTDHPVDVGIRADIGSLNELAQQ